MHDTASLPQKGTPTFIEEALSDEEMLTMLGFEVISDVQLIAIRTSKITPEDQLFASEQHEQIEAALGELPQDLAKVIRLRIFEERSFKEIGPLMKVDSKVAAALYKLALHQLRATKALLNLVIR